METYDLWLDRNFINFIRVLKYRPSCSIHFILKQKIQKHIINRFDREVWKNVEVEMHKSFQFFVHAFNVIITDAKNFSKTDTTTTTTRRT